MANVDTLRVVMLLCGISLVAYFMFSWEKPPLPSVDENSDEVDVAVKPEETPVVFGLGVQQPQTETWDEFGGKQFAEKIENDPKLTKEEKSDLKEFFKVTTEVNRNTLRDLDVLLPMIRYDNFIDTTADVDMDNIFLRVGNEKGEDLKSITLKQFLQTPKKYLTNPDGWKVKVKEPSLYAKERDSHALVSGQFCFLPIPKKGKVSFTPAIFNYQSTSTNPAVLALVVTREGTSAQVLTGEYGQRLYFNQNGKKAAFTGERKSDFETRLSEIDPETATEEEKKELEDLKNAYDTLNMVMIVQIPLKSRHVREDSSYNVGFGGIAYSAPSMKQRAAVDVEDAVIGHGELEGEFKEIPNLEIERDSDFPVRVTVQFYQATSSGLIDESIVNKIADSIELLYTSGDFVGSLVVEGDTRRPTEYTGRKIQPKEWWMRFWERRRDRYVVPERIALNTVKETVETVEDENEGIERVTELLKKYSKEK